MNDMPIITVIIPTRERCDVLESALRTVTAQDYPGLRIIVSDNCSADATAAVVERANDRRITYVNTGKRVSMSHNWEFALSHVEDGWVTFIGDDDGLMPGAIAKAADILRKTQARALRSRTCTYDWPGVLGRPNGQLIVPLGRGREQRDSRRWLAKVLSGQAGYSELPMIYNGGFVHMSVFDEIKQKTGAFFRSVNPDIYSAVAISRLVDSYVYVREPLAISGTSRHSTGNSFFSKSKERNDKPRAAFTTEGNLPFHPEISLCADGGYPVSLQACVYESYLQSATLGGDPPLAVSHDRQLVVILATAGKHRESIEQWGERFALQHGLDLDAARRSVALKSFCLQSRAMLRKLRNATGAVITERLPVRNVFDASIAAGVIRQAPGRGDTWRFLLRRLLGSAA